MLTRIIAVARVATHTYLLWHLLNFAPELNAPLGFDMYTPFSGFAEPARSHELQGIRRAQPHALNGGPLSIAASSSSRTQGFVRPATKHGHSNRYDYFVMYTAGEGRTLK